MHERGELAFQSKRNLSIVSTYTKILARRWQLCHFKVGWNFGERQVLYPVYKGTFERGNDALVALEFGDWSSRQYTELFVQQVKDFRRSLDYLETRPDIDSKKLAYLGYSLGGTLGAIIPAVEERLKVSVLIPAGFQGAARPEADAVNYMTRVRIPTLMLTPYPESGTTALSKWGALLPAADQ